VRTYRTILSESKDGICILTLNRPEVYNAISRELIAELGDELAAVDESADVKVLIVTGAGKGFQAGADIRELSKMTPLKLLRYNESLVRVIAAVERLRQPVIAAVNGPALGGGLELALACSIRIAAEGALLGLPEVKLGIIPGAGGTQRLPRLIGKGRAYWMMLTGDPVNAEEALRLGLVNRVVPRGEVLTAAVETARKIMANGPLAIELCKNAVEIGMDLPLEHAVQYAQKNCVTCFSTEDMKEGTAAFIEKRKPDFRGR